MNRKIYVVKQAERAYLVRASSRSQALAHIARETMSVDYADQESLVELLASGVAVEEARRDAQEVPDVE